MEAGGIGLCFNEAGYISTLESALAACKLAALPVLFELELKSPFFYFDIGY